MALTSAGASSRAAIRPASAVRMAVSQPWSCSRCQRLPGERREDPHQAIVARQALGSAVMKPVESLTVKVGLPSM